MEKVPAGSGGPGTPVPDIPSWSARDYGNRVGVFRLMGVLDRYGIRGTVALNSDLCAHHPEIIEEGKKRAGSGWATTRATPAASTRRSPGEEGGIIQRTFATIDKATGTRPAGWLGSGLQETWDTLDLLAAEGCEYVCDWTNDDQPYVMSLDGGRSLVSVPYSHEINDKPAFERAHRTADEFREMICRQFDVLYREGAKSGRVMAIALHPYLTGVPHRIDAFDAALAYICGHSGCGRRPARRLPGTIARRPRSDEEPIMMPIPENRVCGTARRGARRSPLAAGQAPRPSSSAWSARPRRPIGRSTSASRRDISPPRISSSTSCSCSRARRWSSSSPPAPRPALSTGLVDPIRAIDKGAPMAIVRLEMQAPPYALLAKPAIKSWSDLKGKTISIGGPKDITRIYLERMAGPNGVKPGEFDTVFAGATSARFSALQARRGRRRDPAAAVQFLRGIGGLHQPRPDDRLCEGTAVCRRGGWPLLGRVAQDDARQGAVGPQQEHGLVLRSAEPRRGDQDHGRRQQAEGRGRREIL